MADCHIQKSNYVLNFQSFDSLQKKIDREIANNHGFDNKGNVFP